MGLAGEIVGIFSREREAIFNVEVENGEYRYRAEGLFPFRGSERIAWEKLLYYKAAPAASMDSTDDLFIHILSTFLA